MKVYGVEFHLVNGLPNILQEEDLFRPPEARTGRIGGPTDQILSRALEPLSNTYLQFTYCTILYFIMLNYRSGVSRWRHPKPPTRFPAAGDWLGPKWYP